MEAGDGFEVSFLLDLDGSTSLLLSFPFAIVVAGVAGDGVVAVVTVVVTVVVVAVVVVVFVASVVDAVEEFPSLLSTTAFGAVLGLLCLESRESFVTTGLAPERFCLITTGIKLSTVEELDSFAGEGFDDWEEPCEPIDFLFLG